MKILDNFLDGLLVHIFGRWWIFTCEREQQQGGERVDIGLRNEFVKFAILLTRCVTVGTRQWRKLELAIILSRENLAGIELSQYRPQRAVRLPLDYY